MSYITLKRIKSDLYEKLYEKINDKFFDNDDEFGRLADEYSEEVKINNCSIMIDIDARKYLDIIKSNKTANEKDWLIAQELCKDFVYKDKTTGAKIQIPKNIMYDKEMWSYLNLTTFYTTIKLRYFGKNQEIDANENIQNRTKRLYLCSDSKIDRTGLRWLWVLADITYYNGNYDLTKIALQFIDPFKAAAEGTLRKSEIFLKAFALAIKKLNCNPKIRSATNGNRKIIPKHIRNYACSIMLDGSITVERLSDVLAEQIKLFL